MQFRQGSKVHAVRGSRAEPSAAMRATLIEELEVATETSADRRSGLVRARRLPRSITQGLGDMLARHDICACEIGNRSRDAKDAMIRARRELQ